MKLTALETIFVEEIKKDQQFVKTGESAWDFGAFTDVIPARQLRGVIASLTKKKIIDYAGLLPENKHCWCPFYKGINWED